LFAIASFIEIKIDPTSDGIAQFLGFSKAVFELCSLETGAGSRVKAGNNRRVCQSPMGARPAPRLSARFLLPDDLKPKVSHRIATKEAE